MKPIYLHNDFLEIAGPIRGRNPATGQSELYHSTEVEAFLTATAGSDEAIAPEVEVEAPEIGTSGQYSITFEADAIDTALGALAEGTVVYRVLSGPGDLRVEDAFALAHVRPSDPYP